MHALNVIKALGPIDVQNVRRDTMLRWMVVAPLGIALMARWVFPTLLARLGTWLNVDVLEFYPMLLGYILLLIAPQLCGMVIGFLLLDQRDDQTLTALLVTPLSLNNYLLYRLMMPIAVCVPVTLVMFPIAGLVDLPVWGLVLVAIVAAPIAPLFALALAVFAENKVQGFALTKASGIVVIAPFIASFLPWTWQILFAVVPTYWPANLFWSLQRGDAHAWVYGVGGLAYAAFLLLLLTRRLRRVLHQ